MTRRRTLTAGLVAGALAVLGACSSDAASLDTLPPVTLAPSATVAATNATDGSSATDTSLEAVTATSAPAPVPVESSAPASTAAAPTTAGAATPTSSAGPVPSAGTDAHPELALSPDGPWTLVDSAPGVTSPGRIYELMPKLWAFIPTEESPDDGSIFVPTPDDIPIIEAYLRSMLVYFRSVTQDPIDLDDPGWAEEYGDGGRSYRDSLRPRRERGEHADLDAGVVLRPYVIADERDESRALVFDCLLDGSVFRSADGALAPGSAPGVARVGLGAEILASGGAWKTTTVVNQSEACL